MAEIYCNTVIHACNNNNDNNTNKSDTHTQKKKKTPVVKHNLL